MWGPVLGFPVQSRQRHTGYILAKGQEDDLGTGASLIWTEAERAGNVQHRGEKTQGNLSNVHEHLRGGCKKLEPGSFQWCPMTGSEIMENKLKHRSVLLNIRKPYKSTQFITSQTLMKNIKSPRLNSLFTCYFSDHLPKLWYFWNSSPAEVTRVMTGFSKSIENWFAGRCYYLPYVRYSSFLACLRSLILTSNCWKCAWLTPPKWRLTLPANPDISWHSLNQDYKTQPLPSSLHNSEQVQFPKAGNELPPQF